MGNDQPSMTGEIRGKDYGYPHGVVETVLGRDGDPINIGDTVQKRTGRGRRSSRSEGTVRAFS